MNVSSPDSPAPLDLTGRRLGDYQIFRRLGRGGMADVYLAKQESLNRNVALKVLKPELAKDESYVARFRNEAQAAAKLVQSNIVQIYDVGDCDGFYFIAQEYIQGRNLRQHLARHGAVEPVMAINVLRQCAMALREAGDLKVIHRDIKPENIMLSTKGEVKITDFGLARITDQSANQALTQIGITMGTPLYMSPEQVEGANVDQRSDIYSLGVTAYHMLAGQPPFDGENALAIAVRHLNETPISLELLRPDIPKELCVVIDRMMGKKRDDRPRDASQLLKELRKVKIDVDDDWEMIIEKLSVSETSRFSTLTDANSWSQSKLAATRQLENVMKGNIRSWWKSPKTLLTIVGLSLAGLIGGGLMANSQADAPLLNVSQTDINNVPRKNTVREQYQAALRAEMGDETFMKKEKRWKSVESYFPVEDAAPTEKNKTRLVNLNAKARLAELYLKNDRLPQALAIFDTFVEESSELEEDFRVTGHAGRAIVYAAMPAETNDAKEEQTKKINEAIDQVGSKNDQLNEFMGSRFLEVIKKSMNQSPAKATDSKTLRNWFQRLTA
ncbi:MAG: serine/threonine-protein kinase [Mariniblastus sp.]